MTYTCTVHRKNVYGKPEDAWDVVLTIWPADPMTAGEEEYEITSAKLYAKREPETKDRPFGADLVDLLHEDVIHDLRREAIVAWEADGECDQAGYPEGMDGGRDNLPWAEGRDGLD